MKKQEGFSLIGVLLIISALVVNTGGVLVWQRQSTPRLISTPTLTVSPSVTKKPTETPVLPTETAPIPELEAKEKCEASGGKWAADCSSNGCGPSRCLCSLPCSEDNFPQFDYFKDPSKDSPKGLVKSDLSKCGHRVESGEVCKDCQSNSDCGETRFSQGRAYCFEYQSKCINGICYEERFIYSGYNIKNNACQDTCGDGVCDNYETVLCTKDCE